MKDIDRLFGSICAENREIYWASSRKNYMGQNCMPII